MSSSFAFSSRVIGWLGVGAGSRWQQRLVCALGPLAVAVAGEAS